MFFRNLTCYRLPAGWPFDIDSFNAQLAQCAFLACANTDSRTVGWVPPKENAALALSINGQYLVCLKHEEKILPGSVVKRFTEDRVRLIQDEQGRRVGRKERLEIKEQIITDLLPRAFTKEKKDYAWIDPVNGLLIVDSASKGRAEDVVQMLRKTLQPMPVIKLLHLVESPSSGMNSWIAAGEAPTGFTIDQDLELRSAEQARVRYERHTLESNEIRQHIADGKVATKLALTWNDRISFVLTEDLTLKRMSFLDILKEDTANQAESADEQFDLDFTLMTGEVSQLLAALIASLGGEAQHDEQRKAA